VGTRCRVSYLDSRNIEHAVDVTADSLFEAAAIAVRAFREGALVEELPVPGTELRITVFSAAGRAQSSLTTGGTVGSNRYGEKPCVEMLQRERLRELLGLKNEAVR